MIEAQLSEAVTQLHLTAVETLNRLLKSETDPAELRRLLTIAVRVRHPAAERPKPRTAPDNEAGDEGSAIPASPNTHVRSATKSPPRHRSGSSQREELNTVAAIEPMTAGHAAQSPPHGPPLSGRHA